MTYRVLLVDDEPIILSGIKFMIDWGKNGCAVAGTARNGQQALEQIDALHPDIVLCDINMPVLSGIGVLQTCAEKPEAPVFIMLTNHEEFDLARQSMRYKAVDYLLKSQLEADALEHSLALAKAECTRRGSLARVQIADSYIETNRAGVIAANVKKLLAAGGGVPAGVAKALSADGVCESFCLLQLMLDFSALPALGSLSEAERGRLYAWEQEVVEKLAGNIFPHFALFDPDGFSQSIVLVCWDIPSDASAMFEQFYTKLCAASGNITQTRLSLLATRTLHGERALSDAPAQLAAAREYYYLTQCDSALYGTLPPIDVRPLPLEDISNRLVVELRSRNAPQCAALLDRAIDSIIGVPHRHSDALRGCAALYSAAAMVLSPMLAPGETGGYFTQSAAMLRTVRRFQTRAEASAWIAEFRRQVLGQLEQLSGGRSDVLEKAKRYVQENVDRRIMLQDVADHVNISAGYLSALFKKEYNQNFVDYINDTKTKRACALICEGRYRIYEISYMLGFENAYYFTKVFKRHTGFTPTEYQRRMLGKEPAPKP